MQEMQRLEYNGETVMSDWLVGESFPEEVIGELSLERRVGSGGGGGGAQRELSRQRAQHLMRASTLPINIPQWLSREVGGQFENNWIRTQRIRILIMARALRDLSNYPVYFLWVGAGGGREGGRNRNLNRLSNVPTNQDRKRLLVMPSPILFQGNFSLKFIFCCQ